jgi:lysozyme
MQIKYITKKLTRSEQQFFNIMLEGRLIALIVCQLQVTEANRFSFEEEMSATTSTRGIDLIKRFETFQAKPYLCPGGLPTVGYGSTFYEDSARVRLSDPAITMERADSLLHHAVRQFETSVDSLTRDDITQNQFDALVSFCFNVGPENLKTSTLLRKINADPNDQTIRNEFAKWTRAKGKKLAGLVKRREAEWKLYCEHVS